MQRYLEVLEHHARLGDGIYLGWAGDGWRCARPQIAVLVLGAPRADKTVGLIIPNVLAASGAVVSTSTKPDVLLVTAPTRSRLGQCWLYDPTGSAPCPSGVAPVRWSPVPSCVSWDMAHRLAKAMVLAARPHGAARTADSEHWSSQAAALLGPMLHAAALDGTGMATVLRWVNRRALDDALGILHRHGAEMAGDQLDGLARAADRELSASWSTAGNVLDPYRSERTLAQADAPNFDPAGLPLSTDTVYVAASERDQALVAPLVVGLIEQITAATYSAAGQAIAQGLALVPPVLLALDEVANIAPLPALPALFSQGGSQGLAVLACFQDLSQARARWGEAAKGFLSFSGDVLVLPGIRDAATLRDLSLLAGNLEVEVTSATWDSRRRRWPRSRPASTSRSTRSQPRLPPDVIEHGRDGEAIVFGADGVSWVRLTPWFSTEPWRSLVSEGMERPDRGDDVGAGPA